MQKTFDTLITSYIDDNVGIADNFLSTDLAGHLKDNLYALYKSRQLRPARTGNDEGALVDKSVRSDKIFWLDRSHNDQYENEFFDLMDTFVAHLNSTCYTGITGYEFHYTLYETGSFYKKHLDQFRNNDSRKYSMIMYLNTEWKKADGGELRIHQDDGLHNISPENGKIVFFKSNEIEHEVLITNKARLSITGWLKVN